MGWFRKYFSILGPGAFFGSHVKLRGCIERYSLHLAGISLTGYQLGTSVTGDKKKHGENQNGKWKGKGYENF